jgi:hypothetical protein
VALHQSSNEGSIRGRRARWLLAVGVLGLLLQGCDKLAYYYLGENPSIAADAEFEATVVALPLQTFVAVGTVQISGTLTSQTPQALPSTLRVFMRQTRPDGALVATVSIDLTVRPDGVIRNQLFPTPAMTIGTGEALRFVFQPLGTLLPSGTARLKVLYEKS